MQLFPRDLKDHIPKEAKVPLSLNEAWMATRTLLRTACSWLRAAPCLHPVKKHSQVGHWAGSAWLGGGAQREQDLLQKVWLLTWGKNPEWA